jgi:hypothetical protein
MKPEEGALLTDTAPPRRSSPVQLDGGGPASYFPLRRSMSVSVSVYSLVFSKVDISFAIGWCNTLAGAFLFLNSIVQSLRTGTTVKNGITFGCENL